MRKYIYTLSLMSLFLFCTTFTKVVEITKKAKVHRSLIYAAIKNMIKNGLITKDWKLTDAGKVMVM